MLYFFLDSGLYLGFHKWYLFYYALYAPFEVQTLYQVMAQSMFGFFMDDFTHSLWWMAYFHIISQGIDLSFCLFYFIDKKFMNGAKFHCPWGAPASHSGVAHKAPVICFGLWFWCPYAVASKTCSLVWLWSCFPFLA